MSGRAATRRAVLAAAGLGFTRAGVAGMQDPIWNDARRIGLRCQAEAVGAVAAEVLARAEWEMVAGARAVLAARAGGWAVELLGPGDARVMEPDRVVVLVQAGVQAAGTAVAVRLWRNEPGVGAGRLFYPAPRVAAPGEDLGPVVAALLEPILTGR